MASYHGGEFLWLTWKYTITSDGTVDVATFGLDGNWRKQKQIKLSKQDVVQLIDKFKEADFEGLRNRYSIGGSDIARLTLAITENKKTKQVMIDSPDVLVMTEEVKRFLRVWALLLRKVPAPNADQTPELYEPKPST